MPTSLIQCGAPSAAQLTRTTARSRRLTTVGGYALGMPIALIALWRTGMTAAVPAGLGLTAVARSDQATHRFSLRELRVLALIVALCIVLDTARSSDWRQWGITLAVGGLTVLAVLLFWLTTSAVAFGDVVLVAFALPVPASVSPRAVGTMLFVALVAAGGTGVIQRVRRTTISATDGVALGPALLAGWVVGVMVG